MISPNNNIAYYFSKFMLWICFVVIFFYVLLSIVFYFIGPIQSTNFQKLVFSYPAVFFVPVLLTISIFGIKFFREREANTAYYGRNLKKSFTVALTLVVLMCSGAYYMKVSRSRNLSSKASSSLVIEENNKKSTSELPGNNVVKTIGVAPPREKIAQKSVDSSSSAKVTRMVTATASTPTNVIREKPQSRQSEVGQAKPLPAKRLPSRSDTEKYSSTETRYKVTSVAHFHDEPDQSTRRKAFINHWNNSYATLNPLEERNGFIYVVFTNHEGQTSYGWLRKKDLRAISTRVYEDAK